MDDGLLGMIAREVQEAEDCYGPPASAHESLGVLLEEFQELTEAVRGHSLAAVAAEAVQVAAVAARLAGACLNASGAFKERSRLC